VTGNDRFMLDGSYAYEVAFGATIGTVCFALGGAMVLRWLTARRSGAPSLFGTAIDPRSRLQLAYGIATLAMGGTNYGCRFIDHRYLLGVHEGFFSITVALCAIAGFALVTGGRRRSAVRT